jgi:hypothetical protein
MAEHQPPRVQRVRRARRRARHWKHRLVITTYRTLRWAQRYLPPGVRTLVGVALMAGGVLGFLPILGFWMLPLGIAIASLDFPPLRRRLERWLIDTRRRYHIENTQAR